MPLRPYALSLAVGLLAGAAYGVIGVQSPAPPVIALIGLAGILIGEALVSWLRNRVSAKDAVQDCLHAKEFSPADSETFPNSRSP